MNALGFILASINFVTALTTWAKQSQLLKAGADQAIASALKVQNEKITAAFKVRNDVRLDLDRHPDKLREDDGFRRD